MRVFGRRKPRRGMKVSEYEPLGLSRESVFGRSMGRSGLCMKDLRGSMCVGTRKMVNYA